MLIIQKTRPTLTFTLPSSLLKVNYLPEHDGDIAQVLLHLGPLHPVDRVREPEAARALVRPAGLPRLRREQPRLPDEAGAVGDPWGVDRAVENAEADAVVALGHGELDGLQIVDRNPVTKRKMKTYFWQWKTT